MKILVTTWLSATAGLTWTGSALAHTGREAHVHASGGITEQLLHWAAGIFQWSPGTLVVSALALGLAVCAARSRRRVRGSRD